MCCALIRRSACAEVTSDFLLELGQPSRSRGLVQLLQVRRPIRIQAELGIGGEAGVDRSGERRQFGFEHGGEIGASLGNTESGTVGRQVRLAFCPGQELRTVVGKCLSADDIKIAALQGVGQVDEYAHLQRPTIEGVGFGSAFGNERLPALGCESEVNVAGTSSRRA
jgi:hypothetical protein